MPALGTNLLTITPANDSTTDKLTLDDATAIAKLTSIGGGRARRSRPASTIAAGTTTTTTNVVGTTAAYPTVRAYDVWQGTFLTDPSVDADLRVAVLGATTATNLGLGASDIGTQISVGGLPFRVVGILQPKGGTGSRTPTTWCSSRSASSRNTSSAGDTVRTIGVSGQRSATR